MATAVQNIASLRRKVRAAEEEFRSAIATHEIWKQAAYDDELLVRMGKSRATNAFLVIRNVLRRETLMSLMRLWDNHREALSLSNIKNLLRDQRTIDALAEECADQWDNSVTRIFGLNDHPEEIQPLIERAASDSEREFGKEMANKLRAQAQDAVNLIEKYETQGSGYETFKYLKSLRDQHIAHRQITAKPARISAHNSSDEAVEEFYNDVSKIIYLLLLVSENTYFDLDQTAEIFRICATLFWQPVKGESTEGHPSYRNRRSTPSAQDHPLLNRITTHPAILNGQPTIRGMRLPVRRVIEALAVNSNWDDLRRDYPELDPEDIRQAFAFAAHNLDESIQILDRG